MACESSPANSFAAACQFAEIMIRKTRDDGGALIAAYRDGLGLAAVVVTGGPDDLRIKVEAIGEEAGAVQARWWCRRAAEAECVAAAAARLLRRESKKLLLGVRGAADASAQTDESEVLSRARAAVLAAADKLDIQLRSDRDIAEEGGQVVARIDAELQQQQARGGLKDVNKAYRAYRLDSTARGERVLRYDEWMSKYRQNLIRQVAAALRQI